MLISRETTKHIAVFRALQLGDILCAVPALRNLRRNFPSATISFIGLPNTKALIERFPEYIDEFIPFSGYPGLPEQAFNQVAFEQFSGEMRGKFDVIFQMQGNGTIVNQMLAKLEPKHLAGFSIDEDELIGNPMMMRYPDFGHESLRHLNLLTALGLSVSDTEMEYPLYKEDYLKFEELNLQISRKYICIHPGSRAAWRQWPTSYFAKIGDLCHNAGYQIMLTGTESEKSLVSEVAEQMKNQALNLSGQTDLGTIGVLLKQSSGLFANCTGVSHIAAGLKVPSVIISMDGEAERWAPMDEKLHYTIDWTKQPNLQIVEQAVAERFIHQ